MAISKKALLAKPRLVTKEVEVEGFDQPVRFRELTAAQRIEFAEAYSGDDATERTASDNMRGALNHVVRSMVDDDDEPLFTAEDAHEGIKALMEWSFESVQALISACWEVNGMAANSVKEEVGNSDGEAS